jgi:RNA polymerase sigma-70 factor (ECF subfamily)
MVSPGRAAVNAGPARGGYLVVDDREIAAGGRAFAPAVLPGGGRRADADAMDEPSFAYDDLIRPVEPLMMRSIWRILRQREAAEDAFQDALTIVWRKRRAVARHPNPRALILRISIDAAYDALRRSRRRLRHETGSPPVEAADPSARGAERLEEDRNLREAVLEAVGRLPKRQATAALLRLVEERPYPEIAAAMACSEATVRIHVMRARAKLAARLAGLAGDLKGAGRESGEETRP